MYGIQHSKEFEDLGHCPISSALCKVLTTLCQVSAGADQVFTQTEGAISRNRTSCKGKLLAELRRQKETQMMLSLSAPCTTVIQIRLHTSLCLVGISSTSFRTMQTLETAQHKPLEIIQASTTLEVLICT